MVLVKLVITHTKLLHHSSQLNGSTFHHTTNALLFPPSNLHSVVFNIIINFDFHFISSCINPLKEFISQSQTNNDTFATFFCVLSSLNTNINLQRQQ